MTIRVTLEVVPLGEENQKRTIEVINISNWEQIGFDLYSYRIEDNIYKEFQAEDQWVEHSRKDGALSLVAKALTKLDFFRKNHP